jgi:hypothetical protein
MTRTAVLAAALVSLFTFAAPATAAPNCPTSTNAICVKPKCSLGPPPVCSGCAAWKCVVKPVTKPASKAQKTKPPGASLLRVWQF